MPYIKKEWRPNFDRILQLVEKNMMTYAVSRIVDSTLDIPANKVTGCLNYLFTQMFRKLDNIDTVGLVFDSTLQVLFWSNPSYSNYEKVTGLLTNMIHEYNRRDWKNKRIVTNALKALIRHNENVMDIYEDKKRIVNGDLD